jgi:hypothetical protein
MATQACYDVIVEHMSRYGASIQPPLMGQSRKIGCDEAAGYLPIAQAGARTTLLTQPTAGNKVTQATLRHQLPLSTPLQLRVHSSSLMLELHSNDVVTQSRSWFSFKQSFIWDLHSSSHSYSPIHLQPLTSSRYIPKRRWAKTAFHM